MRLVSTDGHGGSVHFLIEKHFMHPQPDKNTIRIQSLAKRERLSPEMAAEADNALVQRILAVISTDVTTVAGYRPIRREADITTAMEQCAARGLFVCLPIIEAQDKPLYFRRWRPGEALEKGRYGVEVPPAEAPTSRPDIIFVPLVAFDRSGHRLGYGAGYYDRTITHLRQLEKNVKCIGVAYAMQEVEQLPVDNYDQRLDMVVTEKEILEW